MSMTLEFLNTKENQKLKVISYSPIRSTRWLPKKKKKEQIQNIQCPNSQVTKTLVKRN